MAGYGTNVLLARVGPETLGFYGFLLLLVSLINTFFVLGGSNVLVNFYPSTDDAQKRVFLRTYAILLVAFSSCCLGLFLAIPQLVELVFGRRLDAPVVLYLIILLPVLLAQFMVWGILQAELRFKVLAFSQNSVSWLYLSLLAVALVVGLLRPTPDGGSSKALLTVVVAANCASILVGLFSIRLPTTSATGPSPVLSLPGGFWAFALTLHCGTLLNFVILNAAPLFVIRELGLRDLGYFRAVAVLAQFVAWVPMVLDRLFYPSVCELVRTQQPVTHLYDRFARLYLASSSVIAMILILFSGELLAVFGRTFTDSGVALLQLMSAGALLSAPMMYLNFALVTAHQKTAHTMGTYAIGAVTAVALYSALVPRLGLLGVGIAYFLMQLVMLGLSVILARRFTRIPFPTRSYLIALVALAVGFGGSLLWPGGSLVHLTLKVGVLSGFLVLAVTLRLITRHELKELIESAWPWRAGRGGVVANSDT
jgi:O-antigen/teichoic acid export membrane protein